MAHRIKLGLIVWLAWPLAAWATTTQSLIGGHAIQLPTSGTNYTVLVGHTTTTPDTVETSHQQLISAPGTLSGLRVLLDAAPAGTGSYQVQVRINSGPGTVTCTVSGAATTCSDLVNSDTVAAGDIVDLSFTATNTPTTSRPRWTLIFTPTTAEETNLVLGTTTFQAGDALPLNGYAVGYATNNRAKAIFPVAGTLKNLYIHNTDLFGTGGTATVTVYVNDIASALTCSITDPATTCHDTTHSVSIAANDAVYVRRDDVTGAGFTFHLATTFVPTASGNQIVTSNDSGTMTNNSTQYFQVCDADAVLTTTEAQANQLSSALTATNISVALDASPGGTTGYTFTLSVNNTPTALACTVSGTNTTCNASGSIAVTAGQTLDTVKTIASGVPTARRAKVGYAFNIPATSSQQTYVIND